MATDLFGREVKEEKKEKKEAEAKKGSETKTEVISEKPYKLPATGGPTETPKSVMELLEFLSCATPETQAKVKELAKSIREEALRFHRVFVKKDAPEGDYFTDEDEALEAWGVDGYKWVFRQEQPLSEDGQPQPLGRLATKAEEEGLIKAYAARKRKAEKAKKADKEK